VVLALLFSGSVEASGTAADQIICVERGKLRIWNDHLTKIVGKIRRHQAVKVFQSFEGENAKYKEIAGENRRFLQIQTEDGLTGWVQDRYVKLAVDCPSFVAEKESAEDERGRQNTDQTNFENQNLISGNGLDDPSCCVFPLAEKPHNDFTESAGRFGASRNGGRRKHGACDLYHELKTPILAVQDGEVVKGLYRFLKKTYALEVVHNGGFVVRYGEVTSKRPPEDLSKGSRVDKGQVIGYMGKVKIKKNISPMLHFELYSGSLKGSLSGRGKFKRRADLLNPTQYLIRWQN
jgi:murein DD-endopeptidase MepM/ murein hydrolase activator NlpD